MPELPEVEWARRNLERWLSGRRVVKAEAEKVRTFRKSSPRAFGALRGPVSRLLRKGKVLLLAFDEGPGLLCHLGMSGKWVCAAANETLPHSRARLHLDNHKVLHFQDARLFGFLEVVEGSALERHPDVLKLGRDPLVDGLSPCTLREALGESRRPIKVALLNQTLLAGLGNIHAQEALFRARLHPGRTVASFREADYQALCRGILDALDFGLNEALDEHTVYLQDAGAKNPFLVYGKAGLPCPSCQNRLKSCRQAGRTTHFCPRCQKKGKSP